MTILEWLKASTRYTFEDIIFQKIAIDRGLSVDSDVITLTTEQKELMTADIIFIALILSPSSTAMSLSSHNNASLQIGSESVNTEKRKFDIQFMKSIYKKYNDPKFDSLDDTNQYIKILPIEDEIWE